MDYEERIRQLEQLAHAQTRALDSRGLFGLVRRWWIRVRFHSEPLAKQIKNDNLFAQNVRLKRQLREASCPSCGSGLVE
jgi:hypothetical protein